MDCTECAMNKAKEAATGSCNFELVFHKTPTKGWRRLVVPFEKHSQSIRWGKRSYETIGRQQPKRTSLEAGDCVLLSTKYLNIKKLAVAKDAALSSYAHLRFSKGLGLPPIA